MSARSRIRERIEIEAAGSTDVNRAVIAIHESAHAICAERLGLRISFVQAADDSGAWCGNGLPDPFRSIVVAMAGMLADARYRNSGEPPGDGWRSDVRDIMDRLPDDPAAADAMIEKAMDVAELIVTENWKLIEKVAAALLARRYLTDKELADLIDPHKTPPMRSNTSPAV